MRPVLSVLFAALVLAGCDNPTSPASSDLLRASASNRILNVENTSNDPVYLFVADKDRLALLDWVPCTDPATCESVDGGATARISYSDIYGVGQGSQVVIFHWRLIPAGAGKYKVDSIRNLEVELR